MLRGAFIGFGNVAAKGHLPGWQSVKDVQIIAATDVVATQRKAFLEAYPAGRWHESVDALLSDKTLDFVDICTPPSSHPGLIERALDVRDDIEHRLARIARHFERLEVTARAPPPDLHL